MVYTPVVLTTAQLEDKLFQNIYSLLDSSKLSGTTIKSQDDQNYKDFPSYTIYIPDVDSSTRDMRGTNQKRQAKVQIEYNCNPVQGYRQLSLMSDAFESAINTNNNNLRTARLRFISATTVSTQPVMVSQQTVFGKIKTYTFEVLL